MTRPSSPGAHDRGGHGRHAMALTSVADIPPVPRRRVSHLTVDCPDCPAGLGVACQNADGTRRSNSHLPRRRLATRLDNEARDL